VIRKLFLSIVAMTLFVGFFWASDIVTLQGERTVYTAGCVEGTWAGDRCTGKLVAAERFRFRALKAHNEVFFWNVGVASDPTGKFTQCVIADGRNWVCQPTTEGPKAIALAMQHGKPVRDMTGKTRPTHPVSKWTWTLLDLGVPVGDTVSYY
jgi:hypothetical protein